VKCPTVCQPWPWAIIYGQKRIENRDWPTKYRGPLTIHAGKSKAWLQDSLPDGTAVPLQELEFGKIIVIVDLVDCVPVDQVADDPFAYGPWCWILQNPRPLAIPIPYKEKLGLFEVPDSLLSDPPALVEETPTEQEPRKYCLSNGMTFMADFCNQCAVRGICRILPKTMCVQRG
jgi:ASCH domain